jgi:hypothetical protein
MAKKSSIETGVALEARIQRLFNCQGAFAERALLLRPAKAAANLVTDVDVVAHDYSINFHHTRIYAECKGGRNVSTLDRVVWVRGMMSVLGAERGYLVVDHCSPESSGFAAANRVEILQHAGLDALENALRIGSGFWPGRANFFVYEPIDKAVGREADGKSSALQAWIQEASEIWREASALSFSYGRLNNLLAQVEQLGAILKTETPPSETAPTYAYAVGALLVRLSQYVLFAASDTLGMTKIEREEFIAERLTSGSLGLEQTRKVMRSALNLAKAKLQEHGVESPPNWDAEHLVTPPSYARAFAEVVDRVVADGHRARMLPLALELRLFGYAGDERGSSGLIKRVGFAMPMTGLIRGFAVQSLGLPDTWIQGPVTHFKDLRRVADEGNGPTEAGESPALPGIKV